MTLYSFQISNGETFNHSEEFPSDDAACVEALMTVRDIDAFLSTEGGTWSIEVARDQMQIFRIGVCARRIAG